VSELAVFGSAVREDFSPDSDLDVLVSPSPGVVWSLLQLADMRDDLAALVSRPVDLVVRRAVERSPNWIRRREILGSAETVYAA
jgi:predicted nucleotidyltransferase